MFQDRKEINEVKKYLNKRRINGVSDGHQVHSRGV